MLLGQDPAACARGLLGLYLVREPADGLERRIGRIVEVEAYGGERDLASHARFGRTERNAPMYGAPGHAYVYLVYGMHACLNVVTGPEGDPAAVLIRAVEPVAGIAAMRAARTRVAERHAQPGHEEASRRRLATLAPDRLAAGPGLVAEALGITRRHSGTNLLEPGAELRLEACVDGLAPEADAVMPDVVASERIGIGYAPEPWRSLPWRFHLRHHPAVSRAMTAV